MRKIVANLHRDRLQRRAPERPLAAVVLELAQQLVEPRAALLGGAGGYQPDTVTPEAWSQMALGAGRIAKAHEADQERNQRSGA